MKNIISIVLTGGPCAGKSKSIIELKKSSNECRLSTPKVAKKLNDRGIGVWKSHPNFYRINVEENFESKFQKLNKSILELLNRN